MVETGRKLSEGKTKHKKKTVAEREGYINVSIMDFIAIDCVLELLDCFVRKTDKLKNKYNKFHY